VHLVEIIFSLRELFEPRQPTVRSNGQLNVVKPSGYRFLFKELRKSILKKVSLKFNLQFILFIIIVENISINCWKIILTPR